MDYKWARIALAAADEAEPMVPYDEVYGPEGIRTGQVAHLNDAIRIQAERADRAERAARELAAALRLTLVCTDCVICHRGSLEAALTAHPEYDPADA